MAASGSSLPDIISSSRTLSNEPESEQSGSVTNNLVAILNRNNHFSQDLVENTFDSCFLLKCLSRRYDTYICWVELYPRKEGVRTTE